MSTTITHDLSIHNELIARIECANKVIQSLPVSDEVKRQAADIEDYASNRGEHLIVTVEVDAAIAGKDNEHLDVTFDFANAVNAAEAEYPHSMLLADYRAMKDLYESVVPNSAAEPAA